MNGGDPNAAQVAGGVNGGPSPQPGNGVSCDTNAPQLPGGLNGDHNAAQEVPNCPGVVAGLFQQSEGC